MNITVYTTGPDCHKCNLTKRALAKAEIPYTEVLLADAPEAADRFRNAGMMIAPVVVTDTETWFDFRIDKIRELTKAHKALAAA
ncbi:NrdH-like glutaredoxin [Mycobacterium phage Estes]|uniref:NrdH-like glutaredoxin n=1 Tax=Mycobacterium phage Estes TaxID=2759459 RepID=A0A7G9A2B5_9CAUD|nr:NrdH-like glutaredoxin [Mycobacterium phage Estes]QNL30754.1 NrdH-like glutaredoxin [Mycobacterium phage Estes]